MQIFHGGTALLDQRTCTQWQEQDLCQFTDKKLHNGVIIIINTCCIKQQLCGLILAQALDLILPLNYDIDSYMGYEAHAP